MEGKFTGTGHHRIERFPHGNIYIEHQLKRHQKPFNIKPFSSQSSGTETVTNTNKSICLHTYVCIDNVNIASYVRTYAYCY